MITKSVLIFLLFAIAVSLFAALRMMSRNAAGDRQRMAMLLKVRVWLSVFLLGVLALSIYMGWIVPHDVQSK